MANKEWTVMFYFATDNALSPLVVSQLKAIKEAGFHEDVDVVTYFDSNEAGVPTRVLDVNRRRKRKEHVMIGDGRDSFVHNFLDDDVHPEEISGDPESPAGRLSASLKQRDSSPAGQALANFLGFCSEHHRAKNYILILMGHGLVVGNDAFLPDDNPVSAITLEELQYILEGFTADIKATETREGGVFQLLALHSCAMSAVEVAYQLRGTARFMLGSEGISYVGSWPYRQMLKRIFNFVDRAKGGLRRRREDSHAERDNINGGRGNRANGLNVTDARDLVERLYFHALFNATDFSLSGYSLDLSLCNLEADFDPLTEAIRELVTGMRLALDSERGKEMILLAHWESQSYWDESYTDLYDFCFCLRKRCRIALDLLTAYGDEAKTEDIRTELEGLKSACSGVMKQLERQRSGGLKGRFKKVIVHACHFGSNYQYSHGLSVYFPWSRPLADAPPTNVPVRLQLRRCEPGISSEGILERYRRYAFNVELGKEDEKLSWINFLEAYLDGTERKTRKEEEEEEYTREGTESKESDEGGRVPAGRVFNRRGGQSDNPFPALSNDKPSPSTGASCACPSIKNYPTDEVTAWDGRRRRVRAVTVSDILLRKFSRTE